MLNMGTFLRLRTNSGDGDEDRGFEALSGVFCVLGLDTEPDFGVVGWTTAGRGGETLSSKRIWSSCGGGRIWGIPFSRGEGRRICGEIKSRSISLQQLARMGLEPSLNS